MDAGSCCSEISFAPSSAPCSGALSVCVGHGASTSGQLCSTLCVGVQTTAKLSAGSLGICPVISVANGTTVCCVTTSRVFSRCMRYGTCLAAIGTNAALSYVFSHSPEGSLVRRFARCP